MKDETKEQEQEQEQGLVPHSGAALALQGFADIDNNIVGSLNADIESILKQAAVTEFVGARTLLDQSVTLLDAFPFEMQEDSKERIGQKVTASKVMLVVADSHGEIHNIMQNANPSRERYILLYEKVKAANLAAGTDRKFALTNVVFREVGEARFGNRPVVLQFTPETQWIENL